MEIKNPEYLVEIARQQGVTRAAEKLFVTQSTLSQYLLKMEAELGMPLFSRSQNRLIPTDAGNIYIQAARDILRIQEMAEAGAEALRNRGHIDMGVTSIWGARMMVEIMPLFQQQFPGVTLRLQENRSYEEMKGLLKAGEIDLAVMAVPPEDDIPAQGYTHLRNEEIVLILAEGHPFCGTHSEAAVIRESDIVDELRDENFLFSGKNSSIRKMEEALFARLMFRPHVVCELNSNDVALAMVARGIGAALIPEEYAVGVPGVRTFRLDPPLFRQDVLVFRRGVEKTEPLLYLQELIVTSSQFRNKTGSRPKNNGKY